MRVKARFSDDGKFRRKVTGIGNGVTQEEIDRLYPDLEPKAKYAMLEAHNDVWKHGIITGNEKGIVVGRISGTRLQIENAEKELTVLKQKLIDKIFEQGMSQNELSHRVIEEIAESYGWTYTRYI